MSLNPTIPQPNSDFLDPRTGKISREWFLYLLSLGTTSGSSGVQSVTGLNTDNTDPANPVIDISVDGVTVTGAGTPGDPLVAVTSGGTVESVTGLNTDNTDPANPIVQISVDGSTVTGAGTPGSPLVATGAGFVPTSRTISTTAPISGGGDLSTNRTITTSMATSRLIGRTTAGSGVMEELTVAGTLSLAAGALTGTGVATSRAINTVAPLAGGGDLSADRTLTTSMNTGKLIGRTSASTGVMEEIAVAGPLSLAALGLTTSMATNKLIGRGSASTGVMEEITLGTNLALSATTLNALPKPKAAWVEAPTSTDIIVLFFITEAWTLAKIESLLPAGAATPSVTFSVKYGTDVTGSLTEVVTGGITTTSITTGDATTVFNNGTIPANNFVLLVITAVSGTVPALSVSLT